MAHLAHHDRGFFCSMIILVPPNAGSPSENTVDFLWNQGCNVVLVQVPKEGPVLKTGTA